ncbi:uncharacterized protein LOC131302947 [Rhododendron vialii]|uniref:uncharacterized protein LOC131302947 n=1 Tax=Rhododendron vialii TaxID=182163 RepID=UPI00265EF85B|nr:uncharacterized protein LOC131302947 [Rhododendron vialii]
MEWVREAVHLMLAMEKEFHKIAGGASLQLRYPLVDPAPVVQPQGQARAAPRRKSVRPPPQKKTAGSSSAPATTVRQVSSTRPGTRGVEIAFGSDEPQFRRELRKRPTDKRPAEGPSQKKRREKEEEEEEEVQSPFSSSSDNTADDPGFKIDPRERDDEEEDDDDDEDLFDD